MTRWATVGAVLALAATAAADDGVVGRLSVDLDGDGVRDTVRITRVGETGPLRFGGFAIEVSVGDHRWTHMATNADGLVGMREAKESFPEEIAGLQRLRPKPLAAYDINGDGATEIVAHFKVPLSHTSHHMVILGWDREDGECVGLLNEASDQWLLMDAGNERVLVAAWVHGLPQWGNARVVPATGGDRGSEWTDQLPWELAAKAIPVYLRALGRSPSEPLCWEIRRELVKLRASRKRGDETTR